MEEGGGGPALRVRILALGAVPARSVAALERAIAALWAGVGPPEVRTLTAGDDRRLAARSIRSWCDAALADVVLTVGRAGHLAADFAPEVTGPLLERALPGIEERMCLTPPLRPGRLLFRGRAGMRRGALVVNLPADERHAGKIVGFLAPVLAHALEKARGGDRECGRPAVRP